MAEEKLVGQVTHYYPQIGVAAIAVEESLKVGDWVHFQGVHEDFRQMITQMQLNHADIEEARKGQEVGIKVSQGVHEHTKVFKAPGNIFL